MHTLPPAMILLLRPFAPLFAKRVWGYAQVLLVGAILAPAQRTVAAALRVMGLAHACHFQRYHRVLNRDCWSSLAVSRVLLGVLVTTFASSSPLVIGVDETIERRRGVKIAAKGISRDAVRSSHSHFVKASGLHLRPKAQQSWMCLMLLVPIPWAGRVWATPFLTALAPSERANAVAGRRHKTPTDWARQLLQVVRRWYPQRTIVAVADSGYAALSLLAACATLATPITMITRLRLDAALYAPAPPRPLKQNGRPHVKGARLPTLAACAADPTTHWQSVTLTRWYGQGERTVELASHTAVWYHAGLPPVPIRWVLIRDPDKGFTTQALLCTHLTVAPEQIVAWFVLRWQMEVTLEEVRRHLGVETQRQWTTLAIARTTPALLGLFSLVTLLAHPVMTDSSQSIRQAAWYRKRAPTFSDALAQVRRDLWACEALCLSDTEAEMVQVPRILLERLTDTLCYVA